MEIKASIRYWRMAPRKVRLVADQVRGRQVQEAIESLLFAPQRAAKAIEKLLRSAVANAAQRKGVDVDSLVVREIAVDQGPTLKRFRPRARGRASPIHKKTSHVRLVLEEKR